MSQKLKAKVKEIESVLLEDVSASQIVVWRYKDAEISLGDENDDKLEHQVSKVVNRLQSVSVRDLPSQTSKYLHTIRLQSQHVKWLIKPFPLITGSGSFYQSCTLAATNDP